MPQIAQLIKKRKSDKSFRRKASFTNELSMPKLGQYRWEHFLHGSPPEVFITLDDADTFDCKRFYRPLNCRFIVKGFQDQLTKTHDNQRDYFQLFQLFIRDMNGLVGEEKVDLSNYGFKCLRSLRNMDGDFELVNVVTKPFTISANGRVIDYISWYTPLKVYEGESFKSEILQLVKSNDTFYRRVLLEFRDSKKEMFQFMQFTHRQQEVMEMMALGYEKSRIAVAMNISKRTIEKYNQQILLRGQYLFPLNDFLTAKDVVKYLGQMGII